MAQPPDISDTFVREVDENLRRDRLRDFAKQYGGWLIGAVVLFLAACGGLIYWQQYQQQQRRSSRSSSSPKPIKNARSRQPRARRRKQLDDLSKSGSKAVRATALFARAALAHRSRTTSSSRSPSIATIAGDSGLPKPYRDAALIRQTALEFDSLQPQEVVTRLQPLAKPRQSLVRHRRRNDRAWRCIKQGKKAEAGQPVRRHRQRQDRAGLASAPAPSRSPGASASTPAARSPRRPSRTDDDQERTAIRSCRLLIAAALAASGCGVFKKGKAPRPRSSASASRCSTSEGDVEVDPATAALADDPARPGRQHATGRSPAAIASKSMGQLALGTALARAFTVQAGRGSSLTARLASAPVVADGRVYTIDTLGAVRAFDASTGARALGEPDARSSKGNEASLYGGGVAYDNGRIYATNGLGYRRRAGRAQRRHRLEGAARRAAARRADHRQRRAST